MKEKIDEYFEKHKEEILTDIVRLIAIKSYKQPAQPGMPFGSGSAEALLLALSMANKAGFKNRNYDNYVITADLNDNETELGILAHLDVVPEGDGWTLPPYEATIKDGRIYGRGASDDKGPAVAALYAMKAAREIAPGLSKNVRLILGGDEESGSEDIKYYFSKEKAPPKTFSPDAEFPVINIEKGSLRSTFEASWDESSELPRIVSIKGGIRMNVVPPTAEALVEGIDMEVIKAFCGDAQEITGAQFNIENVAVEHLPVENVHVKHVTPAKGKSSGIIRISVKGQGAHASTPDEGNNAVTALMTLLVSMPFANSEGFVKLCSVNEVFPHGDYNGTTAGVAMEDEISGRLTLNLGIFEYTLNGLKGSIDSRTPICATEENVGIVLKNKLAGYGINIDNTRLSPPHHTPEDSDFVQTLLKAYERYSGRKGHCVAIGGGTYVHDIDGGVAFGSAMPGTKNNIHGADEFAVIDEIIMSAKIFTQVIIDICT